MHVMLGLRATTLFKKEILAQVFSCEFSEIFKNTFLHRTHLVAAFESSGSLVCFVTTKSAMC